VFNAFQAVLEKVIRSMSYTFEKNCTMDSLGDQLRRLTFNSWE
jgi:hypothetical protein